MDLYNIWTIPDGKPTETDCLVVLSYAVRSRTEPTEPTKAIIRLAARWQKKFPRAYVIMSTGDNQHLGVPNSRVMCRYALSTGIPKNRLLEEDKSQDTFENLIFSWKIIRSHKFKHVTVVTYDLHTRRMLAIARKLGISNFNYISVGGNGGPAYGIKTFQTHSRLTIFIYELLAYIYNFLKGQL